MSVLSRVEIRPLNKQCTAHEVIVDGVKQKHVANVDINFSPAEVPQAVITFNSCADIDQSMAVTYKFDPADVKDCIKYLALQLQLDDNLHEAWKSSIYSALVDLRKFDEDAGRYICDYDRAEYILNRLMEK